MNDKLPGFFEGTELPTDWWEALWPDPADVVLRVGIKPGTDVIDLCCGDGWFTLPMARIARRVLALDIDAALVKPARAHLTAAGVTNCDFIVGDAYDVATLSPGPADYVLMANAFHGVPDRERLARAVAKVLRPGGRFAIVNWHSRPREETVVMGEPRGPETRLRIGAEIVRQAVEPSGLKFADVVDVPPYHYAALFENRADDPILIAAYPVQLSAAAGSFVRGRPNSLKGVSHAPCHAIPHNDDCGVRHHCPRSADRLDEG